MLVPLTQIQRINSVDQCSSNIHAHRSHLGRAKDAHSDAVGLQQDLRFCIHKFSDEAEAMGPGANLRGRGGS